MLTMVAILFSAQGQSEPTITPYFKKDPLSIHSVKLLQVPPKQFDVEELAVDLGATYDNPFDPADISLDAKVVTPKGVTYSMPGFLYRPFERSLSDGKEVLTKKGEPDWRIRICPTESGEYTVVVSLKDRTGVVSSDPIHFTADPTKNHGNIRISPRNHQYFEFSDGTPYYPIGANVCWGNERGTFSYDDWLPAYGNVGANYLRLWLGPSWTTFGLEQKGKPEEGRGFELIDLANAWRLDEVLTKARENGMDAMLSIDSFNSLRAHGPYPAWDDSALNKDNGGPLRIWTDFWTNSRVEAWYKAKLRYLVARYSGFSNVFSWEFWNEVDLTEDYSADVVQAWHQRMGDALRSLDPYHHLITTSLADPMGNRNLDLLPELDYAQTHTYNNPDVAGSVLYQQSRKAEWGKPHYVGEIGADSSGPRTNEDPKGLQIHDPLWMSVATGSSGAAMPWYWDNLIAPKILYPLFGALARFTKDIDWPGEDFRRANLVIGYQEAPKTPEWKDLPFENGPIQWVDGDFNRPHIVTFIKGKVDGDLPLPGIQHGLRNHPAWHNPVRFKVDLQRPTRLVVNIGDVSGYGGAILQISIDGDPIMTREFQTGENASMGQSVSKFAGQYEVTVPKGEHTVTVENIGNDWFNVGYRFINALKRTGPAVQAWALAGNETVLIWARQEGRTWRRVIVDKTQFPPDVPALIKLEGLSAGEWKMEVWDTWKGAPTTSGVIHVGIDGKVRLPIPSVIGDLAVKLIKQGGSKREARSQ